MAALDDMDHRSEHFIGLTRRNLVRHMSTLIRTSATPPNVAGLLAEARRIFVGTATTYDNFASAALKALQAAELALRELTGPPHRSRATLGGLIHSQRAADLLSPTQLAWFEGPALHFRNKLSHPAESAPMLPGVAELFLRSAHEIVAEMFPDSDACLPP